LSSSTRIIGLQQEQPYRLSATRATVSFVYILFVDDRLSIYCLLIIVGLSRVY